MVTITTAPTRRRRLAMLVVALLGTTLPGAGTTTATAAGTGAEKPTVTLTAPENGVVGKALKIEAAARAGGLSARPAGTAAGGAAGVSEGRPAPRNATRAPVEPGPSSSNGEFELYVRT